MNIFELFILAIGLSMDAFAVSVCKGLSLGRINAKHMCIAGAWFGGFQALMPLVGYFGGRFFADKVTRYSHWVAFVLLVFIGAGMPASLALFLKNWLTLAISRYPPDQELGKRISLGRPHLYQYSVRRSKFF